MLSYCIVVNLDDKYIQDYITNKKCFKVSSSINDADLIVTSFKNENNDTILKIKTISGTYFATTALLGKHNIMNLSLAIAVAIILNINIASIIQNLNYIKNVNHRLSLIKKGQWQIIDDSYNSNYEGMINAIDVLNDFNGFKVIITPGIIETELNNKQNDEIANKINETVNLALLINHPIFEIKINNKLAFMSFKEAYSYLESNFKNKDLIILIANDLPDIYLK